MLTIFSFFMLAISVLLFLINLADLFKEPILKLVNFLYLFSINLISDLPFTIYFFPFTLDLLCFPFYNFLRRNGNLRSLILDLYIFSNLCTSSCKFPLKHCFKLHPTNVDIFIFTINTVKYFLISFAISSLIH